MREWVSQLNVDRGISPATGVILNELETRSMQGSSNKFTGQKRKYRHSLQFLRRWRRRWGLKLGKFDTCDFEEPEELQRKVSGAHPFVSGGSESVDGAKDGEPQIWRSPCEQKAAAWRMPCCSLASVFPQARWLTNGRLCWGWERGCAPTGIGCVEMV